MARNERMVFRASAETRAELEQVAEEERRSVSSLVEKILVEWLAERAKEKQQ